MTVAQAFVLCLVFQAGLTTGAFLLIFRRRENDRWKDRMLEGAVDVAALANRLAVLFTGKPNPFVVEWLEAYAKHEGGTER